MRCRAQTSALLPAEAPLRGALGTSPAAMPRPGPGQGWWGWPGEQGSSRNARRRPACNRPPLRSIKKKKKAIHFLLPVWPRGRGESENRPVNGPGWRLASGGCPAGFHRTFRCRWRPAGSLERGSRPAAFVALLLLLLPPCSPCPCSCTAAKPAVSDRRK